MSTQQKEYDFSRGVRGKFYRPNARLNVPVYLDRAVLRFVERVAESKRGQWGQVFTLHGVAMTGV